MFDVVLPEGTKTSGIQYWVLALMTRYLMSLQFYVEEHFSEIVIQFVDDL